MGNIHPVMRSVAPFLAGLNPPPQSFDKVAFAKTVPAVKARYTGPTADFETDTGTLVLRYDYQPAERATRYEPGCDEDVEITAVLAGEIDILDLCGDEAMEKFKEHVLESISEARQQDAQDRAEDRYLDRMAP